MNPTAPGAGRRIPIRVGLIAAVLILAGFALVVLIHTLLSGRDGASLALLIALSWVLACAVISSLGSTHRGAGLLITAFGAALAWWNWAWLIGQVDRVYLLQHAGSHALLGAWFVGSLIGAARGRGDPVITRLATRLHGTLPPAIHRYTGQVTVLWAAYFCLMATASCLLYAFGTIEAWSVLANLVTMPLVIAIFIVEYLVRLRRHPDFEHVSILDGVRAFMK